MCVAFWSWLCHPVYRFVLALNRDELHSRTTLCVHWWDGEEEILGGRDCIEGGTWLACTKLGRIAFVTNFREHHDQEKHECISRGHLTTGFLKSSLTPMEYAQGVSLEMHKYNGFNLIVADLCSGKMVYVSNRPKNASKPVQEIVPGLHGLSNASLDTPWPKVLRGRQKLEAVLADAGEDEILIKRIIEEILEDDMKAEISDLPNTGYSLDQEYNASSIFVNFQADKDQFGTRSMVVLAVQKNGQFTFFERYLEDGCWKERQISFQIPIVN
eukprot:c23049_g1_i1 orf=127-939(+)